MGTAAGDRTRGQFPPDAPVAASQRFGKDQTDVFVVDINGTLTVASADATGAWGLPQVIGTRGQFPAGAPVAASRRFGKDQTDVFVVDTYGTLTVASADATGAWGFPQVIGTRGQFPPSAPIAASQRFGKDQTDVSVVDTYGILTVASADATGAWNCRRFSRQREIDPARLGGCRPCIRYVGNTLGQVTRRYKKRQR